MGWTDLSFSSGNVLTASEMNALQENYTAVATHASGSPEVAAMTRGWVSFAEDGTILDSENVSSVVRNQLGEYTITWTTPFSSFYGVTFGGYKSGTAGDISVRNFRAFPVSSGSVIVTYLAFNQGADAKEDVQGTVVAWQL
ncbi:MAG: hypothetical protein GOVbin4691_28 [Prokaryotic dsDNA virus sp.]|jgi:hypothetical protein|nr:MAG: hypothetical protein GOVbin4691_28 [Prokaryotic dsDNA virus sp.]